MPFEDRPLTWREYLHACLFTPELIAERWQHYGREWATLGDPDLSEWCHDNAAFHRQPRWKQFLRVNAPGPRPKAYRRRDA